MHDYFDVSYWSQQQRSLNSAVLTEPTIFESYDTPQCCNMNYGSAVFMVFVLAKELGKQDMSEAAGSESSSASTGLTTRAQGRVIASKCLLSSLIRQSRTTTRR